MRVSDPLAPRAWVDGGRESCRFQRQQALCGGNSGPAVQHRIVGNARSAGSPPRTSAAISADAVGIGRRDTRFAEDGRLIGSGDVTGDWVDGLVLTRVALGGPDIDECGCIRLAQPRGDLGCTEPSALAGSCDEVAWRSASGVARCGRETGGYPGGEAAIEHLTSSCPASLNSHHKRCRRLRRCSVVGNDRANPAVRRCPASPARRWPRRQRVSAAGARRIGEVRLEIHPDSARNMAGFVLRLAGWSA